LIQSKVFGGASPLGGEMSRAICAVLVVAALITSGVVAQQSDDHVAKTIELIRTGDKLLFIERGKKFAEPITAVVGEKIRFENKDYEPHTVVSTETIDGRPLFSSGLIKPGEYQDLLFDFDLYERAGGRPASVATLKYRNEQQTGEDSEIRLLSAAKR
jgi:plastocyanin